jgi:hypothetical protein
MSLESQIAAKQSNLHVLPLPLHSESGRKFTPMVSDAMCHVWTAPSWQGFSSRLQVGRCSHVFGLFVRFT